MEKPLVGFRGDVLEEMGENVAHQPVHGDSELVVGPIEDIGCFPHGARCFLVVGDCSVGVSAHIESNGEKGIGRGSLEGGTVVLVLRGWEVEEAAEDVVDVSDSGEVE